MKNGIIMRIIEFVIEKNKNFFSPYIILLDCADISSFKQSKKHKDRCKIITKQGLSYMAYGSYRTLTNRFFYAISKKCNFYEDDVIRPSIRVLHKPELLECDTSFFDFIQIKGFILALDENINKERLPIDTQELLKEDIKINQLRD